MTRMKYNQPKQVVMETRSKTIEKQKFPAKWKGLYEGHFKKIISSSQKLKVSFPGQRPKKVL